MKDKNQCKKGRSGELLPFFCLSNVSIRRKAGCSNDANKMNYLLVWRLIKQRVYKPILSPKISNDKRAYLFLVFTTFLKLTSSKNMVPAN
ncbi:hypothetical protein C6W23_10110 [Bacillus atrophaeus]|nr:hypothetical protein C6W23_10110 [Bacillus atrophaeus]